MRQSKSKTPILMQINPNSPVSEAYRSLRFNIEFSATGREMKTIAVSSANRGEGKSITAVNLAAAFAQAGKKVILVDTDLRNPSVHQAFGADNSKGLTSFLAKQNELHEIISETGVENLSVIVAGPIPLSPTELLASQLMTELLAELKLNYEIIIFDTTPALTLMDAKIMAAKCDGTLLVVEYGKLKRNAAKIVKENLDHAQAFLVGVVVTKIKKKDAKTFMFG
jgi:capsular exopolysaccharide synthesis family protein